MNNLKSYTEYAVTSNTTDFVIGFDFNYGTDAVNVTVDGVPATEAGYTVVYLNSTTIRLNPAVPTGVVRLQRETDIDVPDNRFTAGAKFIASNMDENFSQIRKSQQEVRDGFNKLSTDTYALIDGLDEALDLAQEAAQSAQASVDTVNAFIVNGKVVSAKVLDASGKTQQQINDTIAIKFITATDAGLVVWPTMKKPPYSQKDYTDAFNNGINFVRTLERLNQEGYNEVVFERFNGILPFCYSNLSGSTGIDLINNSCHAILTGTTGLKVRGNNNQIHVMFDSVNRSPYDKATSLAPYQLRGAALGLEHNTDLEITGFELVGDQYTRSWVSGEQNTEQTVGIRFGKNNINTKIDIVGRGFRGDAISGQPRGDTLYTLDNNWQSGGVSTTTGAAIVEAGSYRSPRMDLQGKTIYRNAVQLYTTGYLRAAEFRNDLLGVFFFDTNGVFIHAEKARQCDFIYLPTNCRYIQFVAYDDERTAPVVGYGVYIILVTGSSDTAEIKGEYYANHRGAIANLCGNATVDAYIHDNGTTKYGFPHYNDVTRYGINFEDTFVSKLTVRGIIQNGLQGVLCNARSLDVKAVVKDIQFTGVAAYGTFSSEVSGCEFNNVGNIFTVHKTEARKKNRQHIISNNNIKNSALYRDVSDNPDVFIDINNNVFSDTRVDIVGDGSNVAFDHNKLLSVSGRYVSVFVVRGALSAIGNIASRNLNVTPASIGWGYIQLDGANSSNNMLYIDQTSQRLLHPTVPGQTMFMRGTNVVLKQPAVLYQLVKSGEWLNHIDNRVFEDCVLNGGTLQLSSTAKTATQCDLNLVFSGGGFNKGARILVNRNEETTGSNNTILIKNALIDLTESTELIRIMYAQLRSLSVKFINCTFISDTSKSIALIQGQLSNVTSEAIGCRFINVTNTDEITVVS